MTSWRDTAKVLPVAKATQVLLEPVRRHVPHLSRGREHRPEERTSVAEERKRQSRHREQSHRHRHVDRCVVEDEARHSDQEKRTEGRSTLGRDANRSRDQESEQDHDHRGAEEAPLLTDHREDEVVVLHRKEGELLLAPLEIPLPEELAGPDRDP